MASLLPGTDPVHKVTIVPRGRALGYTWQRPSEDRYLMSEAELEDRLRVLLGGRVAEAIYFGEVSTGAADDLARATDLARRMVTEYGMSEEMGLVSYENPRHRTLFLDVPDAQGRGPHAETTAQDIDREIRRIIDEAQARARQALVERRDDLDRLTPWLLDNEAIEGDQLRAMLGLPPAHSHPPLPVP